MEITGRQVILTPDEQRASGYGSPVDIVELGSLQMEQNLELRQVQLDALKDQYGSARPEIYGEINDHQHALEQDRQVVARLAGQLVIYEAEMYTRTREA